MRNLIVFAAKRKRKCCLNWRAIPALCTSWQGKKHFQSIRCCKTPPKICLRYNFWATRYLPRKAKETKKTKTKQIISLIPMRFVYFPSFKHYFVFVGCFASLWGFPSFAFPEHVENEWAFFVLLFYLICSFPNWRTVWSYDWFPCCLSVFSLEHLPENLQLE